jgi:hypothetical protein
MVPPWASRTRTEPSFPRCETMASGCFPNTGLVNEPALAGAAVTTSAIPLMAVARAAMPPTRRRDLTWVPPGVSSGQENRRSLEQFPDRPIGGLWKTSSGSNGSTGVWEIPHIRPSDILAISGRRRGSTTTYSPGSSGGRARYDGCRLDAVPLVEVPHSAWIDRSSSAATSPSPTCAPSSTTSSPLATTVSTSAAVAA